MMKTIEKTPQWDLLAIGLSFDRVVVELVSFEAAVVAVLVDVVVVVGSGGAAVVEVVEDEVVGGWTHGDVVLQTAGVLSSKM